MKVGFAASDESQVGNLLGTNSKFNIVHVSVYFKKDSKPFICCIGENSDLHLFFKIFWKKTELAKFLNIPGV